MGSNPSRDATAPASNRSQKFTSEILIEKVLPPRRQKKLLPVISKEQLNTLLNHCLSQRDKVILNLLWYSGMRLSEAASVNALDFNWVKETVVVLGKGSRYRKALAGNGVV